MEIMNGSTCLTGILRKFLDATVEVGYIDVEARENDMTERFDKSDEYISFWDEVLGEDALSTYDIEQIQKHISERPLDNVRSTDIIGDFDDDLPF